MGKGWWYKKHCEKQLPLKWHSFRERSNFPWIWGLEIKHQKAHNFVWQGCFFLSLISRNFDDRLSSNFHRFVILCICWDTPTVEASLWQLPIVSTAFNEGHQITLCLINRSSFHMVPALFHSIWNKIVSHLPQLDIPFCKKWVKKWWRHTESYPI